MIDAREPRNGDFATYVENLSKAGAPHPGGEAPVMLGHDPGPAPGAVPTRGDLRQRAVEAMRKARDAAASGAASAPKGAASPSSLWGRGATTPAPAAAPANFSPPVRPQAGTFFGPALRASMSRLLARGSAVAFLGGLAMFVLTPGDDSIPFVSPELGGALIALGFVLFNLSRKLR